MRLVVSSAFALSLLAATGCDDAFTIPVERTDPVEMSFSLGQIGIDCQDGNTNDDVTYSQRTEGNDTYCAVNASWTGTLFDMVEVRETIEADLAAEGVPADVDQLDIQFTDVGVQNVSVRLVKDGAVIDWPVTTYYFATARVGDVGGIVRADWPGDSNSGDPDAPAVKFIDEEGELNGKQALLDHLNAAFAAQEEVAGSGEAEIEFRYDAAVLEEVSGAEFEVDFDLTTTGEGGATAGSLLGG
jgi:hypothetical protein